MDYQARVQKLAERLRVKRGPDALLVTHLPNVRYLCGFTGSAAVLALAHGGAKAAFFTDGRYTTQAREEVKAAKVVVGKRNALLEATAWLKQQRARRVGFEAEHVSFATQRHIAAALAK